MLILFNLMMFFSQNAFARSLKATAEKLGSDVMGIGIAVASFAITMAAIWVMLGKQDGGIKLTQSFLGLLIVLCVPAIVTFVRGLA